MGKPRKGLFKPLNPQKYIGKDINLIVYRSGLEFKLMVWLDRHPHVLNWSSEELKISYFSPLDHRWHYYYPDFIVKMQRENGTEIVMVEVKPKSQISQPKKTKNQKKFIKECMEYEKNQAKWKAAKKYADKYGWTFRILNEDDLGVVWRTKTS